MSNIVEKLKEHLANTSQEQLDAEWKSLEKYNYGPTVEEYIENLKEFTKKKVEYGKKEVHRLELTGEWTKDKAHWRELKKATKYWEKYLNKLNDIK